MKRRVQFDRLEDYTDVAIEEKDNIVTVTFKTNRFGYTQIEFNLSTGVQTLHNEPDLNMFSGADVEYIKSVCAIVWRITYDTSKSPERFEL